MAHTVYIRFKVFWIFSKLLFVLLILTFFEITTPVMRIILTMANIVRNCRLFGTFWLFEDFYSDDAHHANYGKQSLDHHIRHGTHSVYKIYSVFKLFEFAVCFSHFYFLVITTPAMRIMFTMAIIVQIISDMAHSVYQIYRVFQLSEFAVCFAHFYFLVITTPVMRIMPTIANIVQIIISDMAHRVYIRFRVLSNFWKLQFLFFTFWPFRDI